MKLIKISHGVWYTKAWKSWGCFHIGKKAIYIGKKASGYGWRLELFTKFHIFRFTLGTKERSNE